METRIIRSSRRTMSIEIKDNELIVRAPLRATDDQLNAFIRKNKSWIDKHVALAERQRAETELIEKLTPSELEALADQALIYIPERVKHYAPLIGVSYRNITIRTQHTRWGSCSSKGNLNFNCLLMLAPPDVLDSIVVHELCHLKHMNHSRRFYAEVLRVFPEYRKCERWLKDHQHELIARIPE